MKAKLLIIGLIICSSCKSQNEFQRLLFKGKQVFKNDSIKSNFDSTIFYLEKAIEINDDNQEAHYFLGYSYDRKNSFDGKTMINTTYDLTQKSSNEFEKVIAINPKYDGEMVLLDPYSKLNSIWGSLAMKYIYNNQIDSAIYFFNFGKSKGVFPEVLLELNRNVLNSCDLNSILITSGDNFTLPIWYLQTVEHYRNDIKVIDASLINTKWYVNYIYDKLKIPFSIPKTELDSIDYIKWDTKEIEIADNNNETIFKWVVKPTYYDYYLLRGNRIMLEFLKANKFKQSVYFTIGFYTPDYLNLDEYLHPKGLVDKLETSKFIKPYDDFYKNLIHYDYKAIKESKIQSQDIQNMVDYYRWCFVKAIYYLRIQKDYSEVKRLKDFMYKNIPSHNYPIRSKELENYINE